MTRPKAILTGKRSAPAIGYEREMIGEGPDPVGNEVVLREADIRIATGDHLGDIPMRDAEAAREVLHLLGEEGVGRRLADQRLDRRPVAGPRAGLDGVRLRHARASARHVSEAVNPEGVAFADEQRTTAIPREVA